MLSIIHALHGTLVWISPLYRAPGHFGQGIIVIKLILVDFNDHNANISLKICTHVVYIVFQHLQTSPVIGLKDMFLLYERKKIIFWLWGWTWRWSWLNKDNFLVTSKIYTLLLCEEKINPKKNVGWNRMFTSNDFLLDKFCVANTLKIAWRSNFS